MHHFHYKNGFLHAENIDLRHLAETIGTPFYCYSSATLERHFKVFQEAFEGTDTLSCFAVKVNSNQAVLKTLARMGAGMDIVSMGELIRVLKAGVQGNKIVFSGVAKTAEEMAVALDAEIYCFNVESEPELQLLAKVAQEKGVKAPIALRVNPDVDAGTHAKISTGKSENKFGIPIKQAHQVYHQARLLPSLDVIGVDAHIGSQITDLKPFENEAKKLAFLAEELLRDGFSLKHIDFGGGLGVPYTKDDTPPPSPFEYAQTIKAHTSHLNLKYVFEMGRMIAGNAGILITKVIYVKKGEGRNFIIVDAAMNDLIRPTLYDAYHHIESVDQSASERETIKADIVGPVCETGDYLALQRELPVPKPGELLAVMTAGAYGAVLSSSYNSRRLVPEIMVRDSNYHIIRPRPTYEDLIKLDSLPDWLDESPA